MLRMEQWLIRWAISRRSFVDTKYADIKAKNPSLPFLIRCVHAFPLASTQSETDMLIDEQRGSRDTSEGIRAVWYVITSPHHLILSLERTDFLLLAI
jgi:hypothetical protein